MAVGESLGPKIFELRKALRLTQVQLGALVGVSGGAISQFEKEITKPTSETLYKLSSVLKYDLSDLAKFKQLPPTFPDTIGEGLEFVTVLTKQMRHGDKAHDAELRPNGQIETYTELILFNQREFIDFLIAEPDGFESYYQGHYFLVNVLALPNINYNGSIVLEIQGNSMEPRYPDQSRYVLSPVEESHWQYVVGVHAIWLKNHKFFFARIKSNKEGILLLHSDSTGAQTIVELNNISSIWKAGQAVYLPPEEL